MIIPDRGFLSLRFYRKSELYKLIFLFSLLLALVCTQISKADEAKPSLSINTGLFLGSFPDIDRPDIEIAMRFWVKKISQDYGIPATASIYHNIIEMSDDFHRGKINFIMASPLVIINNFDLELLASGYKTIIEGADFIDKRDLLIITNRESGINHFKDVKNKQISILNNDPMCDMYVDFQALTHFSRLAKTIFKEIEYLHTGKQLIYKLFFKKTDVIVVYHHSYELAVELNPQIKFQTQIIAGLSNISQAVGFFNRNVDPEFREKIISIMVHLQDSPKGRQLLDLFYTDKLVRSSLADLKTAQQLKEKNQQLITRYGLH